MGDEPATPAELAAHAARVKALPLASLYDKLVSKASYWGAQQASQDLAQAALTTLVRSGATDWDHKADPTAWKYLCHVMNEDRKNARRKEVRRRTDLDTEQAEEAPPSSDPAALRTVIDRQEAAWSRANLLRRLANAPLATRMVEACIARGAMTPAEIAEHLQVDVDTLYNSGKRIKREMKRVRAAWLERDEAAPT